MDEVLNLVDIFRFITKQDQEEILANAKTRTTTQINCLDISDLLTSKTILTSTNENPWDKLKQILFERLMIEDYNSVKQVAIQVGYELSPNFYSNHKDEFDPRECQILRYLYGCYYRLNHIKQKTKSHHIFQAESIILDQVVLYLTEPDVFPDREKRVKFGKQAPLLLNLVSQYYGKDDHQETVQNFVNSISELCKSIGDSAYEIIITPTYERLALNLTKMAIHDKTLQSWIRITGVFLQHPEMARKFLLRNTLERGNSLTYQSTLLGLMLCISSLPRPTQNETTFFNNPTRFNPSEHVGTEELLGEKLKLVGKEMELLFRALLKHLETRDLFLSWIGRCLYTFKDRKKLWSNQVLLATTTISINDGFLMNFLTVMLHLSENFAGPYNVQIVSGSVDRSINKKMLKIDPRYCNSSRINHQENSDIHILGLSEETFLINSRNKQVASTTNHVVELKKANFITECFFATHQAFTYGFKSIYERFYKLAHNINELEHAFASSPLTPPSSGINARDMIREKIDSAMSQFFNLKAVLMVPDRVSMQLQFCISTAAYLNHLVACESFDEAINATDFKTITLEMLRDKKLNRNCLEFIPEMVVENVIDFFLFLKNFNEVTLASATLLLEPVMTMIIVFMGNSYLMQNPHLRARFAEILECLMPHQSAHQRIPPFVGCVSLFENHPLVEELMTSLVSVFVSIEMTGEGVQFEQKFSYRRPMYIVLEYLWGMNHHKQKLIALAQEAEANIESARPPIFLMFINLLINDATFLLDEALNYMNQLREMERQKKTEDFHKMGPQQRSEFEANYTHVGRLAKFHNVLSLSTIGTLAWITSEIKTIFLQPALVNRVANMLNYFLKHLVGPEKARFKVNDKSDYEFKPRQVLEMICKIYINLAEPDEHDKYKEFCSAISSDGRSYSPNLLPQAIEVLMRIPLNSLALEFEKLSQLVNTIALKNQIDEIPTDDVPDTFLDPIMSTIMLDPVLLPSSRMVVDRSTIARHLLSDQTDPFNRSPLSMVDVIPQTNLKNQIEEFIRENREARKNSS